MSTVPRPTRSAPTRRVGRFGGAANGTVSRWPARTTRSGRPRAVRAMTVLPSRMTSRWPTRRRAASMASASSRSLPLTDSMSQTAAVSRDDVEGEVELGHGASVDEAPQRHVSRRYLARHTGLFPSEAHLREWPTYLPRSRPEAAPPGAGEHNPPLARECAGRSLPRLGWRPMAGERKAWGHGLASFGAEQVLDTWYPDPQLGTVPAGARRRPAPWRRLPVGMRRAACAPTSCAPRSTWTPRRWPRRRLPAPAPALAPAGRAQHHQPRRHLRRATERRVDQLRPVRGRAVRDASGCACALGGRSRCSGSTSSPG